MKFVARALGALLAVLCLWGGAHAQANPLTYSVAASFPDGGRAAGHFTFDADTGTYSNVAIFVSNSATPSLDGTYTFVCPSADCTGFNPADANELTVLLNSPPPPASDLGGQRVFELSYNSPLTDAGQGVTAAADYGTCSTSSCSGLNNGVDGIRHTSGAMVTGLGVPTLTGWGVAVFSLLLAGCAVLRLRRAASA